MSIGLVAVLPAIKLSHDDMDVRENRMLAKWPAVSDIWHRGWSGFWRGFEDAFNDRFFGRDELMRMHSEFLAMLGECGNEKVLVGSDGWLYYRKALNAFDNAVHYDKAVKEAIAERLSGLAERCRLHGKPFVVLIAPDKCRVYPEHVAQYLKVREDSWGRTEDLVRFLRSLGRFPVVYERSSLVDERKRRESLLYFRQDTHWTQEGAWLGGFIGVCDAFAHLTGDSFRRLKEPGWRKMQDEQPGSDLAVMLVCGVPPDDASSYRWPVFPEGDECSTVGDRDFMVSESSLGRGTLFVLRDSFALAMMPFLGRSYKRVYYRRGIEVRPEDGDAFEGSDAVLLEICERNVIRLAGGQLD